MKTATIFVRNVEHLLKLFKGSNTFFGCTTVTIHLMNLTTRLNTLRGGGNQVH